VWLRVNGVADAGCCPSRPIPEDRAGLEEPRQHGDIGGYVSRVRVREGSGLNLDPREELGAVGDGSHIGMVTSGTDAEDGMDYQGGGPSVRGLERQGSEARTSERPARRSRRARPRASPWSAYPTDVYRTEVVRR